MKVEYGHAPRGDHITTMEVCSRGVRLISYSATKVLRREAGFVDYTIKYNTAQVALEFYTCSDRKEEIRSWHCWYSMLSL